MSGTLQRQCQDYSWSKPNPLVKSKQTLLPSCCCCGHQTISAVMWGAWQLWGGQQPPQATEICPQVLKSHMWETDLQVCGTATISSLWSAIKKRRVIILLREAFLCFFFPHAFVSESEINTSVIWLGKFSACFLSGFCWTWSTNWFGPKINIRTNIPVYTCLD